MTTRISLWRRAMLMGVVFFAVTFSTVSVSYGMYYWDTNGSNPGAGSDPSGTWGEDTTWNEAADGTGTPIAWSDDVHAIFSAGDDATSAYTVTVVGTKRVSDIHFDNGAPTLEGGTLALVGNQRLVSALPGITGTINSVMSSHSPDSANKLTKYKLGTVVLGGANTYAGSTVIEGGVLKLGASDRIPDTSNLVLANGGADGLVDTPATFDTGGFNETLGTLRLTGPSPYIARTIDFGHGASALVFANSSGEDWEGLPLTVANYTVGVDSLRFGTSNTGLNPSQLASIVFPDYSNLPGYIDEDGFVEPALPFVTDLSNPGTANTTITWRAISGRTYRVQYKTTLNDPFWSDIFPDVVASDTTASVSDDTSTGEGRYYRVVLLP